MTAADNNGMQDWAADYKGDGQEQVARDGRDMEWQLRLWRWKVAAVDNVGRGQQQRQRQTKTAADDKGSGQQRHVRLGDGLQGGRRRVGSKQQWH
jgi:hypothetical protein